MVFPLAIKLCLNPIKESLNNIWVSCICFMTCCPLSFLPGYLIWPVILVFLWIKLLGCFLKTIWTLISILWVRGQELVNTQYRFDHQWQNINSNLLGKTLFKRISSSVSISLKLCQPTFVLTIIILCLKYLSSITWIQIQDL